MADLYRRGLAAWRMLTPRVRLAAVLAATLLVIWLASGGAGLLRQEDETWVRIAREGVLRVGMDASYPPFEWVDTEGQFHGYDVDLARMLGERWGVEVVFISAHLDGLYDALKVERFDLIISALPYDRTMTRDVLYSTGYFNAGQVVLARWDRDDVRGLDDLAGRRVAVELGSEAHLLVRRLMRDRGVDVDILAEREPGDVLRALRNDAADAIVCDRVTAYGYMREDEALRMVGLPLDHEPYVIAARPDASILVAQVNQALAEWAADGTLEMLGQRWFRASGD
jgi:polar amino acid transport system substrate-binding protein